MGYQCVDCVEAGRKQARAQAHTYRKSGFGYRTVAGARASSQAIVTPVLIVINVLIYGLTAALSQDPMNNHVTPVFFDGALFPPLVADGEWWRLITSGFLHYGPFHLLMNMLALYLIGRDLELLLGKARFLALYGLALLGGGAAVFVGPDVDVATAGASGAVYGLLGGILIAAMRLKLNLTFIIGIIALNLFLSIRIEQISLLGHLGGLVVGVIVTVAMVYAPEKKRKPIQLGTVIGIAAVLLALIVFRDAEFGDVNCTRFGDQIGCNWTGGVSLPERG